MINEIDQALMAASSGELSLGTSSNKLPACPECGKKNLALRKGWTAYTISCWRSCGFIRSREDYELQEISRETLIASGGLKRFGAGEARDRRAAESASDFTPSTEDGYDQE
jgi:hypothetical protein